MLVNVKYVYKQSFTWITVKLKAYRCIINTQKRRQNEKETQNPHPGKCQENSHEKHNELPSAREEKWGRKLGFGTRDMVFTIWDSGKLGEIMILYENALSQRRRSLIGLFGIRTVL